MPSPDVGALATVLVQTPKGEATLGSLWQEGPVLLVFLRQFGCAGCSLNVTELGPRAWELERLGVQTILIGNGRLDQLQHFVEEFSLADKALTLVTDPSLRSHALVGLRRSLWATMGPLSVWQILRELGQGHLNRFRPRGDLTQQGGALLLDRERNVVFVHRSRRLADHVPAADLVDAALRLKLRGSGLPA
jgi:peroxiredoxin